MSQLSIFIYDFPPSPIKRATNLKFQSISVQVVNPCFPNSRKDSKTLTIWFLMSLLFWENDWLLFNVTYFGDIILIFNYNNILPNGIWASQSGLWVADLYSKVNVTTLETLKQYKRNLLRKVNLILFYALVFSLTRWMMWHEATFSKLDYSGPEIVPGASIK